MRVCLGAADVLDLVRRTLRDFGVAENELIDLTESLQINDGKLIARTYQATQYLAQWVLDAGVLQFFNADGQIVRSANLFMELEPDRLAA